MSHLLLARDPLRVYLSIGPIHATHEAAANENGASVVIVSHNLGTVVELADRAMWLDSGKIMMMGAPLEVIDAYQQTVDGSAG